ncbi:MAG: diversity-generating retroelement protein bAvd family protein [Bacteroidetes bacterium]|nr:MAG: diversity-generating retroelement protein bAvd family protein [Bacteroidota bacterium]
MATGLRNLLVYQKGFSLAMDIFELIKTFPKEEKFGLISQIRNSSRSVCSNLGEGYRKRRYPAHFISKVSDADMENSETQVWLDFALACKYISKEQFIEYNNRSSEIGKLLNNILNNPEKYS